MGSLQTILEMILFCSLVLTIFGGIVLDMGQQYGGDLQIPIVDNTNTKASLTGNITEGRNTLEAANVNFDSQSGLTIPSLWGMLWGLLKQVWFFISGDFITQTFAGLHLGSAGGLLAIVFKTLWFVVLIGIVIFTFFKVRSV